MHGLQIPDKIIESPIVLDKIEYPYDFGAVADRIGNIEASSLLWHLPAFQIRHIPVRPSRNIKYHIIKSEYNGTNAASLAVRLGMNYQQVVSVYENIKNTDISIEPLNNIYMLMVAQKCGMPVAIHLVETFPGHAIHIPRKGKSIMTQKLIKRDFNGNNQIELAVKYDLSIAYIYRILKKINSGKLKFEQLDLFKYG